MPENYWTLRGNAGTNAGADFLGTTDGQPLVLKTGGKETMRLDAAQNVGIGTESPRSPLHVKGTVAKIA